MCNATSTKKFVNSFDVEFMEALSCSAKEYMFGAISVTSFKTIYIQSEFHSKGVGEIKGNQIWCMSLAGKMRTSKR